MLFLFSCVATSESIQIQSANEYEKDKIIISLTKTSVMGSNVFQNNYIVIMDKSGKILEIIPINSSDIFSDSNQIKVKKTQKSSEAIINLDY